MLFSSQPVSTTKLQKQLDVEMCVSTPTENRDSLWVTDPDNGHGDFSSCQFTPAASIRIEFPDPIPRGGEA